MHTTPVSFLQQLQQPFNPGAWTRSVRLCTPFLFAWARRAGAQENDAIRPLEPLPADWQEGQQLRVEKAEGETPVEAIDRDFALLATLFEASEPADEEQWERALQDARRQAKEKVRRHMGLAKCQTPARLQPFVRSAAQDVAGAGAHSPGIQGRASFHFLLNCGSSLFSCSQKCAGAEGAVERRRFINEAGRLLPQSLEYAALREQHGVQRQSQRFGDRPSRLAFLYVPEERLPRHRGEGALHPLQQRRDDVLVVLAVPQSAQGAIG
jgi:hypothetical protein